MELISKFGTSGMKSLSSDLEKGSTVTASLIAPYYGDLEKVVIFKGGHDYWRLESVDIEYTITDENGISQTNTYGINYYGEILEESHPVVGRTPTKL